MSLVARAKQRLKNWGEKKKGFIACLQVKFEICIRFWGKQFESNILFLPYKGENIVFEGRNGGDFAATHPNFI